MVEIAVARTQLQADTDIRAPTLYKIMLLLPMLPACCADINSNVPKVRVFFTPNITLKVWIPNCRH